MSILSFSTFSTWFDVVPKDVPGQCIPRFKFASDGLVYKLPTVNDTVTGYMQKAVVQLVLDKIGTATTSGSKALKFVQYCHCSTSINGVYTIILHVCNHQVVELSQLHMDGRICPMQQYNSQRSSNGKIQYVIVSDLPRMSSVGTNNSLVENVNKTAMQSLMSSANLVPWYRSANEVKSMLEVSQQLRRMPDDSSLGRCIVLYHVACQLLLKRKQAMGAKVLHDSGFPTGRSGVLAAHGNFSAPNVHITKDEKQDDVLSTLITLLDPKPVLDLAAHRKLAQDITQVDVIMSSTESAQMKMRDMQLLGKFRTVVTSQHNSTDSTSHLEGLCKAAKAVYEKRTCYMY